MNMQLEKTHTALVDDADAQATTGIGLNNTNTAYKSLSNQEIKDNMNDMSDGVILGAVGFALAATLVFVGFNKAVEKIAAKKAMKLDKA